MNYELIMSDAIERMTEQLIAIKLGNIPWKVHNQFDESIILSALANIEVNKMEACHAEMTAMQLAYEFTTFNPEY